MRTKAYSDKISVRAIAGTHVVLLGMNMKQADTNGVLGFAIERTVTATKAKSWLEAFKTFEAKKAPVTPGDLVPTNIYPIQAFFWGDYTALPNTEYSYRIVAMTGAPGALKEGPSVQLNVTTENPSGSNDGVYFNRGVAGSQAYAREFDNQRPDDVPDNKAFEWLSRGAFEALEAFIGQANDNTYALRAAVYEFDYLPVLEAYGAAKKAGADVEILFDAKRNSTSDPRDRNLAAIKAAGIGDLCTPLESNPSYIAHNKFIVLLKDGQPTQVLTGSMNITEGGIFGHSNVVHVVRDPAVAQRYLDYWTELQPDPDAKVLRSWDEQKSPVPAAEAPEGTTTLFSPRTGLGALQWYADRMAAAKDALFVTCPFGVNKLFDAVLETPGNALRYVILNKEDGSVDELRRDVDNRIAFGADLPDGALGRWLKEKLTGYNPRVPYIHTKYLLIDPLSNDPLVISGSANFSNASITNSDENMLVIRGNTHVADIYLSEFMRLFEHFYFRDFVKGKGSTDDRGAYLTPDSSWTSDYFDRTSSKFKERVLFST